MEERLILGCKSVTENLNCIWEVKNHANFYVEHILFKITYLWTKENVLYILFCILYKMMKNVLYKTLIFIMFNLSKSNLQ